MAHVLRVAPSASFEIFEIAGLSEEPAVFLVTRSLARTGYVLISRHPTLCGKVSNYEGWRSKYSSAEPNKKIDTQVDLKRNLNGLFDDSMLFSK